MTVPFMVPGARGSFVRGLRQFEPQLFAHFGDFGVFAYFCGFFDAPCSDPAFDAHGTHASAQRRRKARCVAFVGQQNRRIIPPTISPACPSSAIAGLPNSMAWCQITPNRCHEQLERPRNGLVVRRCFNLPTDQVRQGLQRDNRGAAVCAALPDPRQRMHAHILARRRQR